MYFETFLFYFSSKLNFNIMAVGEVKEKQITPIKDELGEAGGVVNMSPPTIFENTSSLDSRGDKGVVGLVSPLSSINIAPEKHHGRSFLYVYLFLDSFTF